MTAFNLQTLLLLALAFLAGLGLGILLARRLRPAAEASDVASPAVSPLAAVTLLGPNGRDAPPSAPPAGPPEREGSAAPVLPGAAEAPPRAAAPPPADVEPDLFSRLLGQRAEANGVSGRTAVPSEEPQAEAASGDGHPGVRPPVLDAPEGGSADDLKLLKGIGPQNERRLHALGIFHFRQIAAWTPEEVAWVGSYLAFPGRIEREDWIGQARGLAAGEMPPDRPGRRGR